MILKLSFLHSFLWSSQVIRRSDNLSRCISSRLSQAGLNGKKRAKKKIWPSPLFLDLSEGFNIDERVHKAEGREICAARPSDAQRTPEKHVI